MIDRWCLFQRRCDARAKKGNGSSISVVEFGQVYRFQQEWERSASLALRAGKTEAINAYVWSTTGSGRAARRR